MSILRLMMLLLPSAAPRALVEEVIVDGMVRSFEFARNAPPAELESLAERFAATHGLGHEARDQLISRLADTRARGLGRGRARRVAGLSRLARCVALHACVEDGLMGDAVAAARTCYAQSLHAARGAT